MDWNGNLRFSGASITATGRATTPATVLMSVTFLAAGGRWEMLTPGDVPVAWTGTQEQPDSVLSYTSVASVSASDPLPLEGGRIAALRAGDFRIGFTATGYTGTRTSFTFTPV